jgi:DNA relaxase NicK
LDQSPFALREDGQVGTTTVYLGSNESGRMLRVYNKRGPTRIELQMRDDRAQLVAMDILLRHPSKWHEVGIGHLLQYVSFRDGAAPGWWLEFVGSVQSADLKISSSRVISLQKLDNWFKRQVAVAFSVIYEIEGGEYFRDLITFAKGRDRSRYAPILQMA